MMRHLIIRAKKMWGEVARLKQVAKLYEPSKEVYPLGIACFDRAMAGGVREGELITISGSSGEGKTTFATQLSCNLSNKTLPSLFFSYEMDSYYLYEKFKQIDPEALVYSPVELVSGTLSFIEKEIKDGVENKAIKVVFIDHLHYLIDLKNSLSSSLLIGGIVRELKKIAVRNKVIIFLLAHTRKINTGEELNLASIRDSSLIVGESDYVFLIERLRKKKNKIDKDEVALSGNYEFTNRTRITLAKNRRTGKLLYKDFEFKDGKFIEITNDYDEKTIEEFDY